MHRKIIYLIASFISLCALSCNQKTLNKFGNPILKGWYADPEGIIFDGKYWIYPTYSASFDEQVFFNAFSSPDLINWTKHERIIDTTEVKWAKRAMWAPAILKKDKNYFFFFSANDIYHEGEGGIGIAVADRPEGPFKDYLGKPLIDKIVNGAQPIDQFVFKDKDGSYYIYYGGWGHCNVAKLNQDFSGLVPFEDGECFKETTPENYTEGPFLFIRNEKYYFMWSEGDWTGPNYCVAYAIADSPLGPFKREATILKQDSTIGAGAGHHSIIYEPKGNKYYIVYHRRPLGETNGNFREICIDEIFFDEKGFILPIQMTHEGVEANPL